MAQVTNTSHDSYDVPALGLHFEAGATVEVDDADASSLGWPFQIAAATPPADPVEAPTVPTVAETPVEVTPAGGNQ